MAAIPDAFLEFKLLKNLLIDVTVLGLNLLIIKQLNLKRKWLLPNCFNCFLILSILQILDATASLAIINRNHGVQIII